MSGETDHEQVWLGVGILGALAAAAVRAGAPMPLGSGCPLKLAFGIPCLGCGSTRAFMALIEGSVLAAFRLNPLVVAALTVWAAWAVVAAVSLIFDQPRLRITCTASDIRRARWITGAVVASAWTFLILDGR
jgi:hypothetical protein